MKYHSAIKRNEILLFATTQMDLEGIVLSKTNRERQMPHDFTYMWNLKNKINNKNRNKLIDTEKKLMIARGERDWRPEWKR